MQNYCVLVVCLRVCGVGGGLENVMYLYNVKERISGNVFRSMEFQDTRFYFVRQELNLSAEMLQQKSRV